MLGGSPTSFTAADPKPDATIAPLTNPASFSVVRDHGAKTVPGGTMARVDEQIAGRGLSEADVECELATIQSLIDDAQIAVRVTVEALTGILRGRRFKTTHTTGTSGGLVNADDRTVTETQLFGEHEHHPVYAYLTTDDDRGGPGSTAMYGGIKVVLRNAVRDRSTVSSEDSLNMGVLPSPATAVDRYSFRWLHPGTSEYAASMITGVATGNAYAYFEAQVHGGVTVDDIDEVWVPNTIDPAAVAGWAAAAPTVRFRTG